MGKRGPKPGAKAARLAAEAVDVPSTEPAASADLDGPRPEPTPNELQPVAAPSAASLEPAAPPRRAPGMWENPAQLSGDDLREFAYRQGLSRSGMVGLSDERIRTELQYIAYRRSSED